MKKVNQWLLVCMFILLGAAVWPVHVSAATLNGGSVSKITVKKVVTGNEDFSKFPEYTISYTKSDVVYADIYGGTMKFYGIVIPVELSEKSVLYLDFIERSGVSSNDADDFETHLYYDKDCVKEVKYAFGEAKANKVKRAKIENPGTYYILLGTNTWHGDTQETCTAKFRTYFYSAQDQTLKSGVWSALTNIDRGIYCKMVLPCDGHIKVEGQSKRSNGEIERKEMMICNKDKSSKYDYFMEVKGGESSYFLKKGTYYIFTGDGTISTDTIKIRYTFYKLGESPFVIRNGKTFTLNNGDTSRRKSEEYYKYKATCDGYVTVSALKGQADITLCNSSRKAVSPDSQWMISDKKYKSKNVVYGVKKGQVYYLKFTQSIRMNSQLKLTTTAIKEKSGNSRAKAVNLKSGKSVKGVIEAGGKTSDWYKIKVTKKKRLTFDFKGAGSGLMTISLYNKTGKIIEEGYLRYQDQKKMTTYQKLGKGTYFVKISRDTSKSSGYYTLKWK